MLRPKYEQICNKEGELEFILKINTSFSVFDQFKKCLQFLKIRYKNFKPLNTLGEKIQVTLE